MSLTIEDARIWYPDNDPVHGFDHVLRVYRLAESIGTRENADLEIVRTAVLLHDVEGDPTQHKRADHHHAAAEFAATTLNGKGWEAGRIEAVQHCIRSHRFRKREEPPQTIEAKVVFDADKLDAIGAIGVVRAVAYATRAGQKLFGPVSDQFMKTGVLAEVEHHTPYHEYIFKLSKIKDRLYTPTGREIAEKRNALMANFFSTLLDEVGLNS